MIHQLQPQPEDGKRERMILKAIKTLLIALGACLLLLVTACEKQSPDVPAGSYYGPRNTRDSGVVANTPIRP